MLQADNVWFSYRRVPRRTRAQPAGGPPRDAELRDVSLAVDRRDLVAVLGPNGSGKTTLLKVLAGILRPDAGRVTLDGADLAHVPAARRARRIAVVPQETHLAFEYSAIEVVLMGRYPHLGAFELEGPGDLAVAREALAATGTAALERRLFSTLSGGEKQRVVIASALAQAADILLLDEPTASLDLGYQLEIAALVSRLHRSRGITVVVATHDLNFAAAVAQSVVFLREGCVIAAGPTREVLTVEGIRALYDVEAEVRDDARAGHLTVVGIRKL